MELLQLCPQRLNCSFSTKLIVAKAKVAALKDAFQKKKEEKDHYCKAIKANTMKPHFISEGNEGNVALIKDESKTETKVSHSLCFFNSFVLLSKDEKSCFLLYIFGEFSGELFVSVQALSLLVWWMLSLSGNVRPFIRGFSFNANKILV